MSEINKAAERALFALGKFLKSKVFSKKFNVEYGSYKTYIYI